VPPLKGVPAEGLEVLKTVEPLLMFRPSPAVPKPWTGVALEDQLEPTNQSLVVAPDQVL
jgi:hypothetical protein